MCCFIPPPPPMVLLRYNRRSTIPIGAPECGFALRYFIQCSILPLLLAFLLLTGHSSIPSSTSIRSVSISFQTLYLLPLYLPPLSAMFSMDGMLRRICSPWPGFMPLKFIPHSSITIITPFAHPALYIRHSSCSGGAPLFPVNS